MSPVPTYEKSLLGWMKTRARGPIALVGLATLAVLAFLVFNSFSSKPALAESAPAEAICIPANGDAYVDSSQAGTNFGANINLLVSSTANGMSSIYAQFDLGRIPAGAEIVTATLQLYLQGAEFNPVSTMLQASTDAWDESTINWDNKPAPGGTYDTRDFASSPPGYRSWDATGLVKDWYSGTIKNYGLIVAPAGKSVYASFASKENRQEPHPQLCVGWQIPPTPTPTRTPLPTWTPIPTETPLPGPTPTASPPVFMAPYYSFSPQIILPLFEPDLSIFGIEITQGIQCFDPSKGLSTCADNSVPVVNKKDSTARIYLKYSGIGTNKSNVPVRLHIRANNVWYTANVTGKATAAIDQSKHDAAEVYFNVNFNNDVTVDFYAEVDPDNTISETNESNNRYPASGYLTLTFRRRGTMDIVGDRLRYHPSGYNGTQYAGGWAVNGGAADWYEQVLPIRNNGINYSLKSGYLNWTTTLDPDGQHALIRYLNMQWILNNALSWLFGSGAFTGAEHVYGWAPNAGYSGGHADMPIYPHAGGLGVVGIGTDNPGTSTDNPGSGALIFGHELTHDYNVYHTNTGADDCGSNDSNSDFPYGTSSIQEFGFNPITHKIYDPANTHDLMSYCPSNGSKLGWIAPFTWTKLFNDLSTSAASQPQPAEAVGVFRATAASQSLVVNATVYNPNSTNYDPNNPGELGDLYKIDAGLAYALPTGDYAIELRNGTTILASHPFTISFESEYDPTASAHTGTPGDEPPFPSGPFDHADVSFIIPWVDGTTSVALVHGSDILDQRSLSANPPVVSIVSPTEKVDWPAGTMQTLEWQGSDADSDSLSYTVLYSSDGGVDWQTLATGIPDTSLEINVDAMAGTNDARFRVLATDGINTAYVETPNPISIPNKPPLLTIIEPGNGTSFSPGDLVLLQGSATDLEDGKLDDSELHWSSDRQGNLGVGPSLPLTSLEPGWHVITLKAYDSYGVSSSKSLKLFIGERNYLPDVVK
jgi:hypothetical protein